MYTHTHIHTHTHTHTHMHTWYTQGGRRAAGSYRHNVGAAGEADARHLAHPLPGGREGHVSFHRRQGREAALRQC